MLPRSKSDFEACDSDDLESMEPIGAELPPALGRGIDSLPPPGPDACRVARLADRLRLETLNYGRTHPDLAPGLAAEVDECLSELIHSLMPGPGLMPRRAAG